MLSKSQILTVIARSVVGDEAIPLYITRDCFAQNARNDELGGGLKKIRDLLKLKNNEHNKLFSAHSLKGLHMLYFFRKYAIIIAVLLFVGALISVWLFPSSGLILTILFLLCGFVLASLPVIGKHRQAYLQGKTSRLVYIRHILFDLVGILLALIVAALFGRYIAAIATEQIGNDLIKLIAGIMIGLLIGLAVGIFVKQAWERFVKTSPEN